MGLVSAGGLCGETGFAKPCGGAYSWKNSKNSKPSDVPSPLRQWIVQTEMEDIFKGWILALKGPWT